MIYENGNKPLVSALVNEDDAVLKLLLVFVTKLPAMLNEIRSLYEHSDWESLSEKIHSLKGTGGNFGFNELTEVARNIEAEISKKEYSRIDVLLTQLDVLQKRIEAGAASYR
ncbi:MAG: Hpt domain-containing protein [Gammaproteobacteria bacterium]|nr:Hpt domain-containing protein [Gammaproteobacteria bacterium]